MENREAIEILKNMKWSITTKFNAVNNSAKALDMAVSALEKQEKDRWIPVTERLPEDKKKVLVSYDTEDGKKVDISMFDRYGCLLGLVSAWRPLPEAYTEEEV